VARDVTSVKVGRSADLAATGEKWRDLEQRAAGSFFQSWSWTGTLAAERFPDPIVVEATEAGRTVALALFNRGRRSFGSSTLYLGETGAAEQDCPYIEQNGVLTEAGREAELTARCLRAVASRCRLVLSGVAEAQLPAIRRAAHLTLVTRSQASPCVDLAVVRAAGNDYLGQCSANTRQQIRRSDRFYQQQGSIEVETAPSVEAAHVMLDEMAALHQTTWTARGHPGSFHRPFFRRFHRALIETALPRGEIALQKFHKKDTIIGILYGFIYRNHMAAYQSGFAYQADEPRAKPGLTSHARAIQFALDQGIDTYDFLAGEDRYKVSLANTSHRLIWVETGPFWSAGLLSRIGRQALYQ
jgi:CelD/BcsL family acetyltransferase involved in cellulose biosynthesis